jgi:putative transposase
MPNGLFKNKYRIDSARLEEYDYASDGIYFITICTQEKEIYFGEVIDGKMVLNEIGKLADKYWLEIPQHFENVILNEYVVMPNHVHGIVVIDNDKKSGNTAYNNNANAVGDTTCRDEACLVSTYADMDKTPISETNADNGLNPTSRKMQKISPKPKSLSVIVGSYKSAVTHESKIINPNFTWQSRFYDHIIRDENSYDKIRQYIIENPGRWHRDRNKPSDLWM